MVIVAGEWYGSKFAGGRGLLGAAHELRGWKMNGTASDNWCVAAAVSWRNSQGSLSATQLHIDEGTARMQKKQDKASNRLLLREGDIKGGSETAGGQHSKRCC